MRIARTLLALALWLTVAGAAAQSQGVTVAEDLFAVITLQGKPCGKVTGHERLAENDYLVTCETGDRYRVYVNDQDRVVVEER